MTHISQNIPIVVINLEKNKDRRAFMEQQLQGFGVAYEIFPAVDGHHLSEKDKALYSEAKALSKRFPISETEVGCALSHIRIYEKILRESIPEMLILEDDVRISKDFFNLMFQKEIWAPKDWQIIHMGNFSYKQNFFFNVHSKMLYYYPIDTKKKYSIYKYFYNYSGTFAYIIKRETCKYLLKNVYPIYLEADTLLAYSVKELNTYTIFPRPIVPGNLSSTVDRKDTQKYAKLLYKKRNPLLIQKIRNSMYDKLNYAKRKFTSLVWLLFIRPYMLKCVWKRALIDL